MILNPVNGDGVSIEIWIEDGWFDSQVVSSPESQNLVQTVLVKRGFRKNLAPIGVEQAVVGMGRKADAGEERPGG